MTIYDTIAEHYDDEYTDVIHKFEDKYIYDYLKGFLKGKILDLGCGTGSLLDNIKLPEYKYRGIDISANMLRKARMKHPGKYFEYGNMENLHFCNDSFDSVVSLFGSISYSDFTKSFKEILRVLKPGGKYFLMFMGRNYKNRASYILNKHKIYSPAHFLTSKELKIFFPENTKIRGMSYSKLLPADKYIRKCYPVFKLLNDIVGRLFPDNFYFIIVEGKKNA